jgi:polyphosphate glucokinase
MTAPNSESTIRFGVDIGGTGIKGAPVDLSTGLLTADRVRLATPQPATPAAVGAVVAQVVSHFGWTGPIGATFPAAIKSGVAMTAANVDRSWIGTDVEATLEAATGNVVRAVNDADAAGVAELAYGAGKNQDGVVIMVTFGTGIGTALFLHGQLVPNTELGHLEIDGREAEKDASEVVREKKGLSWQKWAKRVDRYLKHLEALFWPDMIIIGGGASRKADKFIPLLTLRTTVVAAALQNDAGIVGAAIVGVGDVTRPAVHQDSPASAPLILPAAQVVPAAKKAPARRAPAKRAPVKRAPAKRAPAKSAVPAKAPAKAPSKPPATKAAATKTAAATKAVATKSAAKAVTKAVTRTAAAAPAKKSVTRRAPRKAAGA